MAKKIYFRADASAEIGYGHFIRTLALADMLKNNFDCTFFTSNPTEYQKSEILKVCNYVSLSEDSKFKAFIECLSGDEIVVLDNYFYTTEYQKMIKKIGCKLVCIDDMHDKHYVSDVIINHALTDVSMFDCEPYTKLCLGFDYALLRRPFLNASKILKKESSIVICFGGSDSYDFTGKCIQSLLSKDDISRIVAIVGDAYRPKDLIVTNNRVEYRSNLSAQQMADAFSQACLVICQASTVCIEALACGAKVAAGWCVDNQLDFYNNLCKNNAIIKLGNLLEEEDFNVDYKIPTNAYIQIGNNIPRNYIKVFTEL